MRKALSTLALSLCLATNALAPASAQAIDPSGPISEEKLKQAVKVLSSDEFEGRAPGTVGEQKTLAYLVDQFKQAGLKPGNHGSWFQKVPLVEQKLKNSSPLRFTGGKTPVTLAHGTDMVATSYRVTNHLEVKDSPVVFVGYGINAPEKGWNDYAGLDVKGKTVIILVNDPDYEMKTLDGPFGGRAMTYYGRWMYKYEEAARQGAAAAFIIHDDFPAGYNWNVVESSWTTAQHVTDAPNGHMDQTIANGWITLDKARELMASAGQNLDSLMAAAKQPGFKAVDLGLKASVSFDYDIAKQESNNVIGILPGTTYPDEYVLYSAHWDHLGHCKPDAEGDDICNGALDNASGTASLIALADAQAKAGPAERSIVFLSVTAEESGLLGSGYYAANPVFPLEKTVGGVNMDVMSVAGLARDIIPIGAGKSELDAYLNRALAKQGRTTSPEPNPENGFYYRSDHFRLAKVGIPMLLFDGGQNLVNGGVEAGRKEAEDYVNNRYHTPNDEYNPNWDWSGTVADLNLVYTVGRELANTRDWPNWLKGDEFRAIRDKSAAARQ